jgi:thiol:disulfide interchange protein DsbC
LGTGECRHGDTAREENSVKKIVLSAMMFLMVAGFAAVSRAEDTVGKALAEMFPKVKFDSIQPSRIKGLYEVVSGTNIAYFSPEEGVLILGQMVDKSGKNLTAERTGEIMVQKAKDLPLDKAIKTGSGKHMVIEITDPDCPYCRKGAAFFAPRKDITKYTFLFPLSIHPDAENKSRYILCAKDRAESLESVMEGKIDGQKYDTCKSDDVEALLKLYKSAAEKMGVNSTPFYLVDGQPVMGIDTNKIEQILAKQP